MPAGVSCDFTGTRTQVQQQLALHSSEPEIGKGGRSDLPCVGCLWGLLFLEDTCAKSYAYTECRPESSQLYSGECPSRETSFGREQSGEAESFLPAQAGVSPESRVTLQDPESFHCGGKVGGSCQWTVVGALDSEPGSRLFSSGRVVVVVVGRGGQSLFAGDDSELESVVIHKPEGCGFSEPLYEKDDSVGLDVRGSIGALKGLGAPPAHAQFPGSVNTVAGNDGPLHVEVGGILSLEAQFTVSVDGQTHCPGGVSVVGRPDQGIGDVEGGKEEGTCRMLCPLEFHTYPSAHKVVVAECEESLEDGCAIGVLTEVEEHLPQSRV